MIRPHNTSASKLLKIGVPLLALISVAVYPSLFLYFSNADQVAINSILFPIILLSGIAIVAFVVLQFLIRSVSKSAIAASLFIILISNYAILEKLIKFVLPTLKYWHISLICLVLIGHIAYLIYKKMSIDLAYTCNVVLCVVFCGLIGVNGLFAAPQIYERWHSEKSMSDSGEGLGTYLPYDSELPNVYYLIMDEYASNPFMQKYYNYDNAVFIEYLEGKGFQVSNTGHNDSFWTHVVMANILNLNYIADDLTSESQLNQYLQNNILFSLIREHGYSVSGVGDVSMFGLYDSSGSVSNSQASTIDGRSIEDLILEKTIFYPISYTANTQQRANTYMAQIDYLKNTNDFLGGSNFIIYHGVITHAPFIFQRDGDVYATLTTDWEDPKYYLDQYIYATKQLQDIITNLLEKDPDSIIIVQSDHSARGKTEFLSEDKTSIFNAVYYRHEGFDIEGLSGVNTLRTILNRLLDTEYEMLLLLEE